MTEAMRERRGVNYREALGHLTREQWTHAVAQCREGWFPTIRDLLDAAATTPVPNRHGLPAEASLTAEESRKAAAAGLEKIRQELGAKGVLVKPGHEMASQEEWERRKAELLAQAREVTSERSA